MLLTSCHGVPRWYIPCQWRAVGSVKLLVTWTWIVSPVFTVIVGPGYCPLMTRPLLENPSKIYGYFFMYNKLPRHSKIDVLHTRCDCFWADGKVVYLGSSIYTLPTKTGRKGQNPSELHWRKGKGMKNQIGSGRSVCYKKRNIWKLAI